MKLTSNAIFAEALTAQLRRTSAAREAPSA
jgi:hypothetical protein